MNAIALKIDESILKFFEHGIELLNKISENDDE